ncbi:MAG: relaxase/mobilization nuclease domain-containing protein [Oscillospiraceae bacterium]|nr:relaxase/mobilization nuclease domain-containing protein [Oscillospiraceae bacterium]
MAVTKIAARKGRLDVGIRYVLNEDKTGGSVLTAFVNCTPNDPCGTMKDTKERSHKTDGVQYYHIIQSFAPGEIAPEQALEIAKAFASEHLKDFEAVIGVHTDREHIHAHIVFNSVSWVDGRKYHSNAKSYYSQIRAVSDRLCREHGLSVIMSGEPSKSVSYAEWLREQRGLPTFKSMLEADLRVAIEEANDFGHFLLLMEGMGYEVKHGKHLAFRLRGQERFIRPGRRNEAFTEEGIRKAIESNFAAIEAGLKPEYTPRPPYIPFRPKTPQTGFLRLYAHYLYLLGKIERRQYPPRMTPALKQAVMRFEQLKAEYAFLQNHGIDSLEKLTAFKEQAAAREQELVKRRTILNAQKKRRRPLYDALADERAYAPAKTLYEKGMTGIEAEFARYMDAKALLDGCGISREALSKEKAKALEDISEVNRRLRALRKDAALCGSIMANIPGMEKQIEQTETKKKKEVTRNEHWRG